MTPSWAQALCPHTQGMIPHLLSGSLLPPPGQNQVPQRFRGKTVSLQTPQNRAMSPKPGPVLLSQGS